MCKTPNTTTVQIVPELWKTIKIRVFTDPEGSPTCAKDFTKGEFCQFLGSRSFGTQDYCLVTLDNLRRLPERAGLVRPSNKCLLWNAECD